MLFRESLAAPIVILCFAAASIATLMMVGAW